MSRVRHSLRFGTAVVGIALALAGCGAGQISQTAGMEPAVNGGEADLGAIAIRDVQLAYPPHGVYEPNMDAVVLGAVFNSGQTDDELVSVTSPVGRVVITGDKSLPAGRSLMFGIPAGGVPTSSSVATTSGSPSTTGSPTTGASTPGSQTSSSQTSGSATSGSATTTTPPRTTTSMPKPISIGKGTLVITGVSEEIRSGKTIELTFTFRSGSVTLAVPIATPTTPRTPAAGGDGH